MKKYFLVKLGDSNLYLNYDRETQTYGFGSIYTAMILDDFHFKISEEVTSMFKIQKQYIYIIEEKKDEI